MAYPPLGVEKKRKEKEYDKKFQIGSYFAFWYTSLIIYYWHRDLLVKQNSINIKSYYI